jgi:hypothetical protein
VAAKADGQVCHQPAPIILWTFRQGRVVFTIANLHPSLDDADDRLLRLAHYLFPILCLDKGDTLDDQRYQRAYRGDLWDIADQNNITKYVRESTDI